MRAFLIALLLLLAIGLAVAPVWSQAVFPGPAGYVLVPQGPGYVYIPLDASANPMIGAVGPAAPASPAAPSVPSVPGRPATPAVPSAPGHALPADWGFLDVDAGRSDAAVWVDGRLVGAGAAQDRGGRLLIALPPGPHRVDAALPGATPRRVRVEIRPGRTAVVRWTAEAGGVQTAEESPGGGYLVVPPLRERSADSPTGTGHFVVPRP